MEKILDEIISIGSSIVGKILLALVVYIVGRALIKWIVKLIANGKLLDKTEGSVKTFTLSFVKILLNVILVISIIGILGVPMASVITVLASAGVAVGLALQGALSNLAGGIMIMLFKPFKQGDYVAAAGTEGLVQEVTLFYTVFLSWDNQRITVPNGSLMNSNVVNYSAEELRRVDLTFACGKVGKNPAEIQDIMLKAASATGKILMDPAPFARLSGGTNESMQFAVRAWCKSEDYWDVYFDMTEKVTQALIENGVQIPAVKVISN